MSSSTPLPGGANVTDPKIILANRAADQKKYETADTVPGGDVQGVTCLMIGQGSPLTLADAKRIPGAVTGLITLTGDPVKDQAAVDMINAAYGNDTPPAGYEQIKILTPDPDHPWVCSSCGAVVERKHVVKHDAWHAAHP